MKINPSKPIFPKLILHAPPILFLNIKRTQFKHTHKQGYDNMKKKNYKKKKAKYF